MGTHWQSDLLNAWGAAIATPEYANLYQACNDVTSTFEWGQFAGGVDHIMFEYEGAYEWHMHWKDTESLIYDEDLAHKPL